MNYHARTLALMGLGLVIGGCADGEGLQPLLVTVSADAALRAQLRVVKVAIYDADSLIATRPTEAHTFELGDATTAQRGQVSLPLSFSIAPGGASSLKIELRGYAEDGHEVIEQKAVARFSSGKAQAVDLDLRFACSDMPFPCESLGSTCIAEARACAEPPVLTGREVSPGKELSSLGPRSDDPAPACASYPCSPDYPCIPVGAADYVCLGRYADWPMPGKGSPTPPSYASVSDGVTQDRVTGLYWQRTLPSVYEGCSGTKATYGDRCTWHEAKLYCARLNLDGRRWRLPSKIELESIWDDGSIDPSIDLRAFPNTEAESYWSASPDIGSLMTDDQFPNSAWYVSFGTLGSNSAPPSRLMLARCVSGEPAPGAGAKDRFETDEASGTVADKRTGLVWQRGNSASINRWSEAKNVCTELGQGYRLPTIKELLTLFDPTQFPSLRGAFLKPEKPYAWSSSMHVNDNYGPWLADSVTALPIPTGIAGQIAQDEGFAFDLPYVRCVR